MSLNLCHFISHIFESFGFMAYFTNPSVVELSVLRGVSGYLCSNVIKAGRMPIYVFSLLKVTHISASAAEDTRLRIALHSVCIYTFLFGWLLSNLVKADFSYINYLHNSFFSLAW